MQNHIKRLHWRFGIMLALWLFSVGAGAIPAYTITDLGTLGWGNSYAVDINSRGEITGSSYTNASTPTVRHAFLYKPGQGMTDIGSLGGNSSGIAVNKAGVVVGSSFLSATNPAIHAFLYSDGQLTNLGTDPSVAEDINNSGEVTGYLSGPIIGYWRAFIYDNGHTTVLSTLGGAQSFGMGINRTGEVTGYSNLSPSGNEAFLYNGSAMVPLGFLPGFNASIGAAINDSGEIVGGAYNTYNSSVGHAFLYKGDGAFVDLGTLGGASSGAGDINDQGFVVGSSLTTGGIGHAFVYDGTMHDLNNLAVNLKSSGFRDLQGAASINSRGQIVGNGTTTTDAVHAFLATPVAVGEPPALALFLAGLLALIIVGRHRYFQATVSRAERG